MTNMLLIAAAVLVGCCVGALVVGLIVAGRIGEDDIEEGG